jgi:hypothetical protein
MSDVIYKYPVELTDEFSVALPRFCQILTVQVQDGKPFMWIKHALNTTNSSSLRSDDPVLSLPLISRKFRLAGTGHPIDELESSNRQMIKGARCRWEYVGTFQLQILVFHLFVEDPVGL